jgi:hypothetical protein
MTRQQFRDVMAERRQWPRGSLDWQYLTSTAKIYLAMLRGVPANEWKNL